MEADYTKRELDEHFKVINLRFDRQDISLGEIVTQTKKTNGRVSNLENWRWFLAGIGSVIVLLLIPLFLAYVQTGKL